MIYYAHQFLTYTELVNHHNLHPPIVISETLRARVVCVVGRNPLFR